MSTTGPGAIVRANPGDAPVLSAIAQAAKAQWGYPPRWLAQWQESLTITPEFIVAHETYVAWRDDRAVGFYAVRREQDTWQLEHLWVLPSEIGRGVGRALFAHAAARARALGVRCLTIESDPHAEGFYLRMGAQRTGSVIREIEGQPRTLPLLTCALVA